MGTAELNGLLEVDTATMVVALVVKLGWAGPLAKFDVCCTMTCWVCCWAPAGLGVRAGAGAAELLPCQLITGCVMLGILWLPGGADTAPSPLGKTFSL